MSGEVAAVWWWWWWGAVNRLFSYLCSNSVERESQETHKRETGEWKQSQVQDNDKVKCVLNGSVQSQRDKAQPADKVCAAEGNGRSGKSSGDRSLLHIHTCLQLHWSI